MLKKNMENSPSWASKFDYYQYYVIGSHSGYVDTFQKVNDVFREFEISTTTTYTARFQTKDFGRLLNGPAKSSLKTKIQIVHYLIKYMTASYWLYQYAIVETMESMTIVVPLSMLFDMYYRFAPQQDNCSMLTRSAGFLSPATQGSEECSASCSEGSDSSCEAMEGPHGDDDGLVIHGTSLDEDL